MAGERYAPWQGAISLLRRAISSSGAFTGRSRRSELILYNIASSVVANLLNGWLFPIEFSPDGSFYQPGGAWLVYGLFSVPLPALIVRRFHDQGRTGWWALPIIVLEAMLAALHAQGSHVDRPIWVDLIGLAAGIAILVAFLLPGADGDNRFGPDPRLQDADDA